MQVDSPAEDLLLEPNTEVVNDTTQGAATAIVICCPVCEWSGGAGSSLMGHVRYIVSSTNTRGTKNLQESSSHLRSSSRLPLHGLRSGAQERLDDGRTSTSEKWQKAPNTLERTPQTCMAHFVADIDGNQTVSTDAETKRETQQHTPVVEVSWKQSHAGVSAGVSV